MKKLLAIAVSSLLILTGCASEPEFGEVSSAIQDSQEMQVEVDKPEQSEIEFADSVNLWFEPDFVIEESSYEEHYKKADYKYAFRTIIPIESADNTYFAILGGQGFPDYYGGIQQLQDGSKAAIFSVWDVNSDGSCLDCKPGTAPETNRVSMWAASPNTVIETFGYEGTGMKSMIYNFDWQLGEEVAMLTSLEAMGEGSLVSAAIRTGGSDWQFIASFYVPTSKSSGMPAGFAFVEDWAGSSPVQPRSAHYGPTFLANESGRGIFYSKAYISGHNSYTPPGTRHAVEIDGAWIKVKTGIDAQANPVDDWFSMPWQPEAPDLRDGIRTLAVGISQ